jgi:PleD family two-component response regulator
MMFCFIALFASAVGFVWMHRQSAPTLRVKPTRRSLASPFYREEPAAPSTPVVLIIDDNPDIRRCLRLILEPMGTILEADSGEQAMSLAMRHRLTLVMADVAMGPMDGLDFCRALKAQAPVPVIMMTAGSAVMAENVSEPVPPVAPMFVLYDTPCSPAVSGEGVVINGAGGTVICTKM